MGIARMWVINSRFRPAMPTAWLLDFYAVLGRLLRALLDNASRIDYHLPATALDACGNLSHKPVPNIFVDLWPGLIAAISWQCRWPKMIGANFARRGASPARLVRRVLF